MYNLRFNNKKNTTIKKDNRLMSKSTYILILFIISLNFFSIAIFSPIADEKCSISLLFWLLIGYGTYKRKPTKIPTFVRTFTILILLSVLLTFLPAYTYHKQTILQSLITNRQMLGYIALPILFKIQPSEKDILKAFRYLFIFAIIVWIGRFILGYNILLMKSVSYTNEYLENEGAKLIYINFFIIYLYYLLAKYINFNTPKNLVWALIVFFFIICTLNRSLIFPSFTIFLFYFITNKRTTNVKKIIFLLVFGIVIIMYLSPIINSLIDETQKQMNDNEYARNMSIHYFLNEASPDLYCKIFGNSMIGITSPENYAFLQFKLDNFYNNNDLGWIGFWNYYGIVPILLYCIFFFKCIFKSGSPQYLKMTSLHMLIPTIWCMWDTAFIILGCIMIYLYYKTYNCYLYENRSYYSKLQ